MSFFRFSVAIVIFLLLGVAVSETRYECLMYGKPCRKCDHAPANAGNCGSDIMHIYLSEDECDQKTSCGRKYRWQCLGNGTYCSMCRRNETCNEECSGNVTCPMCRANETCDEEAPMYLTSVECAQREPECSTLCGQNMALTACNAKSMKLRRTCKTKDEEPINPDVDYNPRYPDICRPGCDCLNDSYVYHQHNCIHKELCNDRQKQLKSDMNEHGKLWKCEALGSSCVAFNDTERYKFDWYKSADECERATKCGNQYYWQCNGGSGEKTCSVCGGASGKRCDFAKSKYGTNGECMGEEEKCLPECGEGMVFRECGTTLRLCMQGTCWRHQSSDEEGCEPDRCIPGCDCNSTELLVYGDSCIAKEECPQEVLYQQSVRTKLEDPTDDDDDDDDDGW